MTELDKYAEILFAECKKEKPLCCFHRKFQKTLDSCNINLSDYDGVWDITKFFPTLIELRESFDPKKQAEKTAGKKKPIKDWGPTISDILKEAKKLRSSSGAPAIHSPAFSLAKASIEFSKRAVDSSEDTDALWKALEKVERALSKTETILYRMR